MDELAVIRGFRSETLEMPEQAEGRVRTRMLAIVGAEPVTEPQRRRLGRMPPRSIRRAVVFTSAAAVLVGAGAAGALTLKAFGGQPVTAGFSALDDTALPPPPTDVLNGPTGFPALGHGPYQDARTVGPGMYIARSGDQLCTFVIHGSGGCTTHLPDGDVLVDGTMVREYDSETAPFQVFLDGFARDNVASIIVTTKDGSRLRLPVENNAFQTTLKNTTFQDVISVQAVSTSGATTALDISEFSYQMPNLTQALPPTVIGTQTVHGVTFTAEWWTTIDNATVVRVGDGKSASLQVRSQGDALTTIGPQAWAEPNGTVTTIAGTAPQGTTQIEINFSDGSKASVPAENGGFLYASEHAPPPTRHAGGTTVRALDSNGNVIAKTTTR
jgi:hypothetical protein